MAGKLFIISAPSGAGKTTLVDAVTQRISRHNVIERVVTYTTKSPRPGEQHNKEYHFISSDEFEQRIEQDFFIEWSTAYGHYYGSPRSIVQGLEKGKSLILIIDRIGAQKIVNQVDVILIWVYTVSMQVLYNRLTARGTETHKQINQRLAQAAWEIEEEQRNPLYHYHLLNDDFNKAAHELEKILRYEFKKNC